VNIIPTSRDLTALRIGRRGPAFIDIAPATEGVCLTASNGHTVHIRVAGDCDRAVRIPFDAFVRAAKLGGKDGFSLEEKTCTAGGYRFPVTLSAPDAPKPPPSEVLLSLDAATTAKVTARIVPAMGDDDSRPNLYCLHLHRRAGVLAAEATNGHILAHMTTPSAGREFDVMVPADAVRSVARAKGDLSLVIGRFPTIPNVRSRLVFVRGNTTVACEGVANVGIDRRGDSLRPVEFPDMVVCIPTTWERSVTVDAAELRRVVTRLGKHGATTGNCGAPSIRMETRDGLSLSTPMNGDGGRLIAPTLPCEGTMKRAVTIQARYILATCGTKGTVTFRFSGDMDPVRVENDGVVCVTMPIRA
jgi:hypothetical protein